MSDTKYKLYLCGPMSGIEDMNRPAFAKSERELRAAGFDCFNPASQPERPGWTTAEYLMYRDLPALHRCHGLAYLPGSEGSDGAKVERAFAVACCMHMAPVQTWATYAPGAWAEDCDPQVARVAALPAPDDRADLVPWLIRGCRNRATCPNDAGLPIPSFVPYDCPTLDANSAMTDDEAEAACIACWTRAKAEHDRQQREGQS